ncbi:MAG: SDR family NAD(P)-dependent oxidoreductase, partial [Bacteroidota bacterium]
MKKNYYIITGTSRGIGEAIAKALMSPENAVYCISRNPNPALSVEAHVKGWNHKDFALDLHEVSRIGDRVREIFRDIFPEDVNEIILINNAGIIHPIREIGSAEADERIFRNVNVNLTAAMIVTDAFIRETRDFGCPRKIVNLTSGAARRTIHGWSAYCAAKAGLEHFSHCIVDEQRDKPNGVKVMAFSPGVVDTEMQQEIRHADEQSFP